MKLCCPDPVTRWRSLVDKNKHPEVRTELVLAMIWHETEQTPGNRYAYRYEPGFQYFYDYKKKLALYNNKKNVQENRWQALLVLGQTEFNAQSASWGLMQVMGAAARERGFKRPYLAELCDPETNIALGTLHLWVWGYQEGKRSTEEALARYNGSKAYADAVLDKLAVI